MALDPLKVGKDWFAEMGWTPFQFQLESWQAYLDGYNGLVNAPTGSGKTYSLLIPILLEYMRTHPNAKTVKGLGVQAIWITPIRALSKEILISANRAIEGLGLPWKVGVRSGDTKLSDRIKQKDKPPQF